MAIGVAFWIALETLSSLNAHAWCVPKEKMRRDCTFIFITSPRQVFASYTVAVFDNSDKCATVIFKNINGH